MVTATNLQNLIVSEERQMSPVEVIKRKPPIWYNKLRIMGEIGIVAKRDKIIGKLEEKRVVCMMVSYSDLHSKDTYKMYKF